MKPKPRRWVQVAQIHKPSFVAEGLKEAREAHEIAMRVVESINKCGKSVRAMKSKYGDTIQFFVRRGGT